MVIAREDHARSAALSSDDVLISILEQLPDRETDSAAALAPVMTVSKRWSALAEPVFWSDLEFTSFINVLHGAIGVDRAKRAGRPIHIWIKVLVISDVRLRMEDMHTWRMAISAFLECATHLRELELNPSPVDHSILSQVARSTSHSLTTLHLSYYEHLSAGPPRYLSLAPFSKLGKLYVDVPIEGWLEEEESPMFSACELPALETMHWRGPPASGFYEFLADSTFGPLSEVAIINTAPLSPLTTAQLIRFFKRNAIEELNLALEEEDEFAAVLPHSRAMILLLMRGRDFETPPVSVVSLLSSTTGVFRVHWPEKGERMWALFDAFKALPKSPVRFIMIQTIEPGELFSWAPYNAGSPALAPPKEGNDRSTFIEKLRVYAAELKTKNIDIVDVWGNTSFRGPSG